jgi:dipeptidyl aminopeptidase/acylaminoacyl peptidase
VPPSRNLTEIDGVRAFIYAVPEATPDEILVGLNDRDASLHDVYRLNIDTGERELLIKNDTNVAAWISDLKGEVRAAWRQTEDGGSEFLKVENGELGKVLYSCDWDETCQPYRFHKNGKAIYIVSDKGDDVDLSRLMLLDAETGKTELVESDPQGEVDFGGALFSDKTEELIGTMYKGDRERIYPRTGELEEDLAFLRKALPDGEIDLGSSTEDESRVIVSIARDVNPGEVYLYDRQKRKVEKLYDSRPDLPSEHLAHMTPVRYKARDGVEIPAYLTLPRGVEGKNLPTIILPHGGPWARSSWGYSSFPQFLANRGYAVLQPNFRGSTGYGKNFLNTGNDTWGTGVMQHDITDGVKYLVQEGIADPKRITIMGGSYGGYATLAGVTFTPDLYAAGVSIVGPSNIITLLNSIPPYWAPIKKLFHNRVGDPDDPADRARLEQQSPFYHADQIKAPLLVIQGANDPRVKQAESDQIVVALRERKRPVEYIVAEDEGHGFAGEENRLAMFALIEEFLAKHIGGRYQKESSPEIAERIASLRVDVNSVEMPVVPEEGALAKTAPLPKPEAGAVQATKLEYRSDMTLGGREMSLESTREITSDELDARPVWRVSTTTQSPRGDTTDVVFLDAESLVPVRREVNQGPVSVVLNFTGSSIKGTMKLPGGEQLVDVALDAPVFGNEGALETALAALPLEPGYRTIARTFDVATQKVRLWSFEVTEAESIEVPAGTFEAFKTTLTAVDGEGGDRTLWISQEAPRRMLRSEAKLPPAMGGGSVATQLVSRVPVASN